MKIQEIINFLNSKFPVILQEKYDNTGEQVAFYNKDIKNIMLAIDIDNSVLNESIDKKCNLVITHHPFLFKPLKKVITGDPSSELLIKILSNEITVHTVHTNLDKIFYNKLGSLFDIEDEKLLIKTDTIDNNEYGFGTIGNLKSPITLRDLLSIIKTKLNLDYLIYSGVDDKTIRSIAAINGAGGSVIEKILLENTVDCIITGDIGYHHCKTAINYGIPVIDAGHYGTEKILLNSLKDELDAFLLENGCKDKLGIFISQDETNPFKLFL